MGSNIKLYREQAIKDMTRYIKELDSHGVPPEEIWDNINAKDYSYYATESDKTKAFENAGFSVEFS